MGIETRRSGGSAWHKSVALFHRPSEELQDGKARRRGTWGCTWRKGGPRKHPSRKRKRPSRKRKRPSRRRKHGGGGSRVKRVRANEQKKDEGWRLRCSWWSERNDQVSVYQTRFIVGKQLGILDHQIPESAAKIGNVDGHGLRLVRVSIVKQVNHLKGTFLDVRLMSHDADPLEEHLVALI